MSILLSRIPHQLEGFLTPNFVLGKCPGDYRTTALGVLRRVICDSDQIGRILKSDYSGRIYWCGCCSGPWEPGG